VKKWVPVTCPEESGNGWVAAALFPTLCHAALENFGDSVIMACVGISLGMEEKVLRRKYGG